MLWLWVKQGVPSWARGTLSVKLKIPTVSLALTCARAECKFLCCGPQTRFKIKLMLQNKGPKHDEVRTSTQFCPLIEDCSVAL